MGRGASKDVDAPLPLLGDHRSIRVVSPGVVVLHSAKAPCDGLEPLAGPINDVTQSLALDYSTQPSYHEMLIVLQLYHRPDMDVCIPVAALPAPPIPSVLAGHTKVLYHLKLEAKEEDPPVCRYCEYKRE